MQTVVLAKGILSVCLYVCSSVCLSFRHIPVFCPDEDITIVRFSALDTTTFLVSDEVMFIRIFAGDHP